MAEAEQLTLVIVSDDWFWRSIVSLAGHRCNRFRDIVGTEDGYMALAHIWQRVEDGTVPDLCIMDARADDPSLARLLTEVRADDATRPMYLAAVGDGTPGLLAVDYRSHATVDPDDLVAILERIVEAAHAVRQSHRR